MATAAEVWLRMLCAVGFAFFLCACAADPIQRTADERKLGPNRESYVPSEYIVTSRTNVDADAIRHVYAAFDVERVQSVGSGRFLLRFKRDPGIDRVRTVGVESGLVEAAQPNYVYRTR